MRSPAKISISRAPFASPIKWRGPTSLRRSTPLSTSTRSTGVSMRSSCGGGPGFDRGQSRPGLLTQSLYFRADDRTLVPAEREGSRQDVRRVTGGMDRTGSKPGIARLPCRPDPLGQLARGDRPIAIRGVRLLLEDTSDRSEYGAREKVAEVFHRGSRCPQFPL